MRVDDDDLRNSAVDLTHVRLVAHAQEVLDYARVAAAGLEGVGLRDAEALLTHDG